MCVAVLSTAILCAALPFPRLPDIFGGPLGLALEELDLASNTLKEVLSQPSTHKLRYVGRYLGRYLLVFATCRLSLFGG